MKKFNESRRNAEKEFNKLLDLLSNPIKKKFRKEFERVQKLALKSYSEGLQIDESLWENHQQTLYSVNKTAYNKVIEAGYKRISKTFIDAGWINKQESKEYFLDLEKRFSLFIDSESSKAAFEMAKTTRSNVEWLIKKYEEAEQATKNSLEFNAFTDIISKALKESKERSIWRSILGALVISHNGLQNSQKEAVSKVVEKKQYELFKIWVTHKDSKVRDTHSMMEGVKVKHNVAFDVPIDSGFTEQMMYPGDRNASIGNWINCRCNLRYEMGE